VHGESDAGVRQPYEEIRTDLHGTDCLCKTNEVGVSEAGADDCAQQEGKDTEEAEVSKEAEVCIGTSLQLGPN
jgi:hypothetical protein